MRLSKCFGIISWFPDKEPARTQRQERINRLFKQLDELWPEYPILIVTQNWKDFVPNKIRNEIIRVDFVHGLGILEARKTLRREFLKRNFDYIIMFDDDAIIHLSTKDKKDIYMEELDRHQDGFAFVRYTGQEKFFGKGIEAPYAGAQLNLCAISRYIFEKEDIIDIDPQKDEGYEDLLYSNLLHLKYPSNEFLLPAGIKCIQFNNRNEKAPSTWVKGGVNFGKIGKQSKEILYFMIKNNDAPDISLYKKYRIIVKKGENQAKINMLIDIQKRHEENEKKMSSDNWVNILQ